MSRRLTIALCLIAILAPGCASRGMGRPLGSIRRARDTMAAEVSDVVHRTGQQASRTWADMLHDWNYVDADGFAEYRDVGGR